MLPRIGFKSPGKKIVFTQTKNPNFLNSFKVTKMGRNLIKFLNNWHLATTLNQLKTQQISQYLPKISRVIKIQLTDKNIAERNRICVVFLNLLSITKKCAKMQAIPLYRFNLLQALILQIIHFHPKKSPKVSSLTPFCPGLTSKKKSLSVEEAKNQIEITISFQKNP